MTTSRAPDLRSSAARRAARVGGLQREAPGATAVKMASSDTTSVERALQAQAHHGLGPGARGGEVRRQLRGARVQLAEGERALGATTAGASGVRATWASKSEATVASASKGRSVSLKVASTCARSAAPSSDRASTGVCGLGQRAREQLEVVAHHAPHGAGLEEVGAVLDEQLGAARRAR